MCAFSGPQQSACQRCHQDPLVPVGSMAGGPGHGRVQGGDVGLGRCMKYFKSSGDLKFKLT